MKMKVVIVILVVACVVLGVMLYATKTQNGVQRAKGTATATDYSNQVATVAAQVNDLSMANLAYSNDLTISREQTLKFSNALVEANLTVTNREAALAVMQKQVNDLNAQVSGLNDQITDLKSQNTSLDERASELTNTIAQLNVLIEETQNKLAVSQTNNAYLQDQLKKQLAQKAELEREFNDLNAVRAQLKKLKDEAFMARRLQLDRHNNTLKKGGQLLMEHPSITAPANAAPAQKAGANTNYDLNVEVGSDGSVKVIKPLTTSPRSHH